MPLQIGVLIGSHTFWFLKHNWIEAKPTRQDDMTYRECSRTLLAATGKVLWWAVLTNWLLILNWHLYLSRMGLGVDLRTDTRKICVQKRLDYVFKILDLIVNTIWRTSITIYWGINIFVNLRLSLVSN
jgi:hypothetical protein